MQLIASILLTALVTASPVLCLDASKKLRHYGMTQWQEPEGLPRNTVHAITQTVDGYIWLATEGGLARFNGREFRVFSRTTLPDFPSNGVRSLAAGKDGSLWIGTRSGLVRYQGGRFERVASKLWPSDSSIRQLHTDGEGAVWAATAGGLARWKNDSWTVPHAEQNKRIAGSLRSFNTHGSQVWVGSTTGLSLLEGDTRIRLPEGLPADTVRSVLPDSTGRIWVGTESRGLYLLAGGKVRRLGAADGFPATSVRVILEDRDHNIWIGTVGNGLYRFANGSFESMSTKEGLASDHIRSLFEDREGNLWVGSEAGGVARFRNGRVATLTTLDGLGSNFIRAVAQVRSGRLLVGTEGAGLYEYTGGRFRLVPEFGRPKAFVTAILEDKTGNLWVGTEGDGAFRVSRSGNRNFSTATGIPENSVWALQEDREGVIWAATSNGLLRVAGDRSEVIRKAEGLRDNHLRGLLADRDGSLWISFRSWGLQHLVNGRFETVELPPDSRNATITSFHQDSAGDLWMTSDVGLLVRSKGSPIRLVSPAQGLSSEYLCQVVEDDEGRLWLSGSQGIFVAHKSDLLAAAFGSRTRVSGITLTRADGMRSSECSGDAQPCGAITRKGEIWFSTVNGVVRIPPGDPRGNLLPPPVVIESVEVNGQPQPISPVIQSPAGNRLFRVKFAALTYSAPEKVQYRYQLEGVDRDWITAGERSEALYHNLPPGEHRFVVMAANEDGVWSGSASDLRVHVDPFFFESAWFFGLLVVAGMLAALGAHWMRTRTLRSEFSAVLNERARIAREIHDTLLQGFAGAALQLNAIATRLKRGSHASANDMERVLEQIDCCMAEARQEIVDLRSGLEGAETFESRLRRSVESAAGPALEAAFASVGPPVKLGHEMEKHLIRIAQEAVANAARHAHARTVTITLEYGRRSVRLQTIDDGTGITVAESGDGHFGIAGMRERAKLLGGTFSLKTQPARGTEVEVIIPTPTRGRA